MGENNNRTLRDYGVPGAFFMSSGITPPTTPANDFELKPALIQLVSQNQFHGLSNECPQDHLRRFLDLCSTVKHNGVTQDYIRLSLFKFSLAGEAARWLVNLPPNSLTTWDEVTKAFLGRFYPLSKTADMRSQIMDFQDRDGESLYDAWERFKALLRACPHHQIEDWLQLHCFYKGLSKQNRTSLDVGAGGPIMQKDPTTALELIEKVVQNDKDWSRGERDTPSKKGGRYDVDGVQLLSSKVDALVTQLKQNTLAPSPSHANVSMLSNPQSSNVNMPMNILFCDVCGSYDHTPVQCHLLESQGGTNAPMEQVNAMNQRFDPYSNTFNPGWKQNPNFSWRNQGPNQGYNQAHNFSNQNQFLQSQNNYAQGQGQFGYNQGQYRGSYPSSGQYSNQRGPPGFQAQRPHFNGQQGSGPPQQQPLQLGPPPSSTNLESMLQTFMANQAKETNELKDSLKQMQVHNKMLEQQIAQMATKGSSSPQATIPSQPTPPRDHANAITTRSGKTLREVRAPLDNTTKTIDGSVGEDEDKETDTSNNVDDEPSESTPMTVSKDSEATKDGPPPYKQKLPFPARFRTAKLDDQFAKFLEVLKKLYVNIPFTEALKQMPTYAKFLKEILTKKRELASANTINLTQHCSAIIQNKLPTKLKDPGSFSIPCAIGDFVVDKALCDLGASVSLMPHSICQRLNLGELKPTRISLQLADRSVKLPLGVLEDVPLRVGKVYIPVDFVVLDMDEDPDVPIILGRPFLATAGAVIDVKNGILTLAVGKDTIEFKLAQIMKCPSYLDDCMRIETIEHISFDDCDMSLKPYSDPLTLALQNCVDDDVDMCYMEEVKSITAYIDSTPSIEPSEEVFLALDVEKELKGLENCEKVPEVELKPLPSHLKYAFLGPSSTYPVIVSADLSQEQTSQLVEVLRAHRKVLGYTISDLKGISPALCMHRILLEEDTKPSRERQRKLNPSMMEVVKKEVLKLLAAGIIYPISDSKWVSPVQVVPKKGGFTVVPNDKGELIPTRTVTGWRMCIDYRKLNTSTRKDHFPLPFIDQMLERLARHNYFCYLDGYSGFFQIPIHPDDQEKTTFTCPYGTYAYRRMPYGLCNAPATFQRCMMSIFADMIEDTMEVFMDDFSVCGSSFSDCLTNLTRCLERCEESHLVLNWEKCHFMVTEGIVLVHKVSSRGIEVDRAKVEVIEKLPPPTSVKAVRSFLGHAGFYRRFIRDFSKITKPLTSLLQKESEFVFDDLCMEAFCRIKQALVSAPIVQPPDWSLPFELMCDASDTAVGAVLGQRKEGKSHVVYYASRTLNEAQRNYTTTEKELLAVVYAFEKFRSYLVGSKVILILFLSLNFFFLLFFLCSTLLVAYFYY
ncbi:Retrovirus-related Pol polyprotein from transposon 17.6 [Bienertia sinuspersici]